MTSTWNYPTTILFGPGRIAELADACRRLAITRPLVVTDPGVEALPMLAEALTILADGGREAAVFSSVRPNPIGRNVEDGVAVYREGRHDGVVAFGGGSALDVGKAVAFMSGQTRPIWDFEDVGDNYLRADVAGIAPIVAVPTTSGTGSEVGRASVITDEASHAKKIIFHPLMQPRVALCDPELTLGLPAHITAATGMDALAHSLEAYCGTAFHPMADGIALEGMRLVHESLARAVEHGGDIDARSKMMAAAAMGATAFQKALGAIHSLSHPLGAHYDLHHGLLNGVVMPYVLEHNRLAIEEKMVRLAAYLDLGQVGFDDVLAWIIELRRTIGIPHTLGELGVDESKLDELVPLALADPSTPGNPVELTEASVRRLFEAAIRGEMA
ncbi:MAG TPA: iron-containing alcohol dehydrogenase [Candidatus Kapabacteria bacterium]|nr:iron-containing alcohol dehydrogenase [Candidatus Kapabacteria bacterium]